VNTGVKKTLATSFDPLIRKIPTFESVNEAVTAAVDQP